MNLYVAKSKIDGRGLFSSKIIPKCRIIGTFEVTKAKYDTIYTIYIDDKPYRAINILKYSNHSDKPNAKVDGDLNMWALQDIAPGEEITWDYQWE